MYISTADLKIIEVAVDFTFRTSPVIDYWGILICSKFFFFTYMQFPSLLAHTTTCTPQKSNNAPTVPSVVMGVDIYKPINMPLIGTNRPVDVLIAVVCAFALWHLRVKKWFRK